MSRCRLAIDINDGPSSYLPLRLLYVGDEPRATRMASTESLAKDSSIDSPNCFQ